MTEDFFPRDEWECLDQLTFLSYLRVKLNHEEYAEFRRIISDMTRTPSMVRYQPTPEDLIAIANTARFNVSPA